MKWRRWLLNVWHGCNPVIKGNRETGYKACTDGQVIMVHMRMNVELASHRRKSVWVHNWRNLIFNLDSLEDTDIENF